MYVNARAIIEQETLSGVEIVLQIRNKPYEGGKLELPGGKVKEFEPLYQALKREVEEETGLQLTHILGSDKKVDDRKGETWVECVQPFAAFQTIEGNVDIIGFYFRCNARGSLLKSGDKTENPRWVSVKDLAEWLEKDPDQFTLFDRAGIMFYLRHIQERQV